MIWLTLFLKPVEKLQFHINETSLKYLETSYSGDATIEQKSFPDLWNIIQGWCHHFQNNNQWDLSSKAERLRSFH